jgi:hypothetical protein
LVEHSLGKRCGSEALPQQKKEAVTGVTSTDFNVVDGFQG